MLGAIAGDIIGSPYEQLPIKRYDFPLFPPSAEFTDDTVLTVATAYALLYDGDYAGNYRRFFRLFPHAGYGGAFAQWAYSEDAGPYNSWGNGSAMRVSPIGFAFPTLKETLAEAERSASVTHNHPEGVKGAQAIAAAIFLARTGATKDEIREYVAATFGYDLDEPYATLQPRYTFDVSCQGTVPAALIAFLESANWEDAVRKAVALGGDSDTLACITGGVADAFYGGLPAPLAAQTRNELDSLLTDVVTEFEMRFPRQREGNRH